MLKNGEFEEGDSGFGGAYELLGSAVTLKTEREAVFEGNHAIQFSAGDTEKISAVRLKLEKNRTYYLTYFIKYPKYDSVNHGYVTYGIADADTGAFLYVPQNGAEVYNDEYQIVPTAADNRWHMQGFTFNTNGQTDFYFVIRGKNALIYMDNIAVFTPENAVPYVAALKKVGNVTVTDEEPTLLGIKNDSDNLFENYDFSDLKAYCPKTDRPFTEILLIL